MFLRECLEVICTIRKIVIFVKKIKIFVRILFTNAVFNFIYSVDFYCIFNVGIMCQLDTGKAIMRQKFNGLVTLGASP